MSTHIRLAAHVRLPSATMTLDSFQISYKPKISSCVTRQWLTGCQRKTSQCVMLLAEQNVHHNPTASHTESLMAADESFSESIPDAVFPRHWWPQAASKSHSFVDNLTAFWWRTSHTWGSELAEPAAKPDPPSQNTWASASLAGSCDKTCEKAHSLWLVQDVCFNTDRST